MNEIGPKLLKRLAAVKLLALDFDGTLTDGLVDVNQHGDETVHCSRKDSLGTNMLQARGIHVVVISKETNSVVRVRCEKMKIDCYHGVDTGDDKLAVLKRYMKERYISSREAVYVGDDVNDLECLKFVGIGATVADGHDECKAIAAYVTKRKGGEHAVREVCDLILKAKEHKSEKSFFTKR